MTNKELPIGVFDSGLGGLSVLAHLRRVMPNERFLYFGDSKNAPYGTRDHGEIEKLTLSAVEKIAERGVKALVIACNTATSICISHLREIYRDIPVIGLEPALKPAVENSSGGKIVVLATPATLSEEKFKKLMAKYAGGFDVIPLAAPGLVEFVENGKTDSDEAREYLEKLFAPFEKGSVESVVLGCTHFPFISKLIKEVSECSVTYDGGKGAALETKRRLEASGLLSSDGWGDTVIENSLNTDEIFARGKMMLSKMEE